MEDYVFRGVGLIPGLGSYIINNGRGSLEEQWLKKQWLKKFYKYSNIAASGITKQCCQLIRSDPIRVRWIGSDRPDRHYRSKYQTNDIPYGWLRTLYLPHIEIHYFYKTLQPGMGNLGSVSVSVRSKPRTGHRTLFEIEWTRPTGESTWTDQLVWSMLLDWTSVTNATVGC